jgi:uncharacterized membrane protein
MCLLAIIGKDWTGPRPGAAPRILDPDDPVRAEVETALSENVRVMPVLVNGATMPKEAEVPASLKRLPYLNAIEIKSGPEFQTQIKHLVRSIDRLIAFDRSLYFAKYLALPVFLMLLSDYLLLFKLDLDPIFLRIASLLIAAVLGIVLFFQVRQRAVRALLLGAAVGLVSVLGMLAINAALSLRSSFTLQAIVPASTREWQEAIEYFVTITATTFAGNVVATAFTPGGLARSAVALDDPLSAPPCGRRSCSSADRWIGFDPPSRSGLVAISSRGRVPISR